MSALFPNVPNLPGVPSINRATASLTSMLSQSTTAETASRAALSALVGNNLGAASAAFTSAQSNATSALGLAGPIFSNGSDVVGSLSGVINNAASGLTSIGLGDVSGALSSALGSIDHAVQSVASISQAISPIVRTLLGSSGLLANADSARQWGLFTQGGALAIDPDNVVAFENSLDARISTYPVEKGGFGSYNKVQTPFDVTLIMSRGGSIDERQQFLKEAQKAWQSTDLYNVVTPTGVYLDMNVVGLRQTAAGDRGAGLMTLELALQKVRETAQLTFTSTTKEPSGAAPVNAGSVQPRIPPLAPELEGLPR